MESAGLRILLSTLGFPVVWDIMARAGLLLVKEQIRFITLQTTEAIGQ
jgi:hypothetical protein